MSVRITWPASTDPIVSSYEVQRAASVEGPLGVATSIPNDILGPNYDTQAQTFFFEDTEGTVGSWYRLIAVTATGLRSQPSTPFQPAAAPVPLSVGTARFIGVNGQADRKTLIISAVGTMIIAGQTIGEATFVVTADAEGRIEVPLVKGSKVRIAVEGTTLVREIIVPQTATFDLIAALSTAPDLFTVQETAPLVERRSI